MAINGHLFHSIESVSRPTALTGFREPLKQVDSRSER